MLIQKYSSQIHKTPNHTPLNTQGPYSFKYNSLICYTDPDVLNPSTLSPAELHTLFQEQLNQLNKEISLHEKFNLTTNVSLKQTRKQYEDLYFYNGYTYKKSSLLEASTTHKRQTQTFLTDSPLDPSTDTQSSNTKNVEVVDDTIPDFIFKQHASLPNTIGISTQSIRNLTGYSYTVQMPWHTSPQKISWQEIMLTDQSNLLVIDGSRQMGKSYGIAELLIEESFVP